MTTTHAAPPPPPPLPLPAEPEPVDTTALPRAGSRDGSSSPLRGDNARLVQLGLLVAGAVLLPLGIVVIGLGWYGIANTPYEYDQLVYLVSGGFLGLGITFVGGFLYFGAWIARIGTNIKESDQRLTDTLLALTDAIARTSSSPSAANGTQHEIGSALVVAGTSTTVHRADCPLLEGRSDVHPVATGAPGLNACRLCRPEE